MPESTNTVITNYRREMLCKVTSGAASTMPAITHIAFGDQGVDSSNNVIQPTGDQTALHHEVGRYPISGVTYPVATTAEYSVVIPASALGGVFISEAALADSAGHLHAIRNMLPKGKDQDTQFKFYLKDEF